MWALISFLIVGLYGHLAHTDTITSTVSMCNSGDFVLRVIKLLSLQDIGSDVNIDGTLWEADWGHAQNKSDNALTFIILQLIDRSELVKNISSELVRQEELLAQENYFEQRLKTVKDEAIAIVLKAFQEKLDKAILNLEANVSAISLASVSVNPPISIPDTRWINLNPAQYRSKGVGVHYEFKGNAVIGLPLTFGNPFGFYAVLVTIVPWNDTSGGTVMQIVYAGNAIRLRSEDVTDPYKWTSWYKTNQF